MGNERIHLFVGLDLSFNSSGITLIENVGKDSQTIEFHRMVFNPNQKTIKDIENVNIHSYGLPNNMNYKRMTILDNLMDLSVDLGLENIDLDDKNFNESLMVENYGIDQIYISTKLMMNAKRIMIIINNFVEKVVKKYDTTEDKINMIVNIEGNIIGNVASGSQLRIIGGLIMLNQEVRNKLITYNILKKFNDFKLFITSPTELKMFFTNNGQADKIDMINSFNLNWDGQNLIPESHRILAINDVVDSFALAVLAYDKYFYSQEYIDWIKARSPNRIKPKKKRKTKPKNEPIDINLIGMKSLISNI